MATAWIETLKKAQKTCLIQDGKKKVHYRFEDGREMAEEYEMKTSELQIRKWKKSTTLGGAGSWTFEIGEEAVQKTGLEAQGLMESASNPIFTRKGSKKSFIWRIRNLPYPIETYDVKVDAENQNIIIRTTNKKYYKKFSISDMERAGLLLSQSNISTAHANNTLIITYNKPAEILEMEKEVEEEITKLKASKDGDVDCAQS